MAATILDRGRFDAVIFDTDGVLTDTATVHRRAWRAVFDAVLEAAGDARPFSDDDYRRYVDGVSRYDGVRRFLASRGVDLPEGAPSDAPDAPTVQGIGNRKNEAFRAALDREGVTAFEDAAALLDRLRLAGIRTAAVSASRNCEAVLAAAGLGGRFDVRVDGNDAESLGFAGKPAPDLFLVAAQRLGVEPGRAVVIEDAEAGVAAGRAGGFGLVVGVAREGHGDALDAAGADVVVADLTAVEVADVDAARGPAPRVADLPLALERWQEVTARLAGRLPAVFLDYDGTLTPIVDDPAAATLPDATREVIERLRERCPVAVISGRDLDDVRRLLALYGLPVAGSHGFDILLPDGERHQLGAAHTSELDAAVDALRTVVEGVAGARLERKRFAIAVHYRMVEDPDDVARLERAVEAEAARHEGLRVTGGKMIFELRPDVDWDKGRALRSVLETLGLDRPDVAPIYVGDDDTDEDAFRALGADGLGVVVRGERDDRPTAADVALRDPAETRRFLERLAAWLEAPR